MKIEWNTIFILEIVFERKKTHQFKMWLQNQYCVIGWKHSLSELKKNSFGLKWSYTKIKITPFIDNWGHEKEKKTVDVESCLLGG